MSGAPAASGLTVVSAYGSDHATGGPLDSSPFRWFRTVLHSPARYWSRPNPSLERRLERRNRRAQALARRYPSSEAGSSPFSSVEAAGSSAGTVTFSGVTSPGMKVMSTSSPGSPSSVRVRPTRIVEPGSS